MMGFLFDENLPRVLSLPKSLPVIHALSLGSRLADSQIWTHSEQHDLVIVGAGSTRVDHGAEVGTG